MTRRRQNPLASPGQVYGEWLVVDTYLKTVGRRTTWAIKCRCSCGTEREVGGHNLVSGKSTRCKRCACKNAARTHGGTTGRVRPRLYREWLAMKSRCSPRNKEAGYFAAGIRVCQEWADDFVAFRDWATASGYRDDLTLDRRDNDRGYSPENCRWATRIEQARNTTANRMLTSWGQTKCLAAWAEDPRCVVKYSRLYARVRGGWTGEAALSTTARGRATST